MTSSRARHLRRERQRVQRRRDTEGADTREARRRQANAALKRDLGRHGRRHAIAFVMFGVAAVIAVGHFFEHLHSFTIVSTGFEDIFLGWPAAGGLALAGAMVYGT